jgi:hypothetical protein
VNSPSSGSDILIVDNSDDNWKALRYLEEWAEISTKFDIATAFFEIGSLLALDGKWQSLEKIRILMGEEVTLRTNRAFTEALENKKNRLDQSLEAEKEENDFLQGVAAIVEAMSTGKIECRVYRQDKFHAKAYITHAKQAVIGSAALVGSSNFTNPGLTTNIELNVQLRREVEELQKWYEKHWNDAEDVTPDILTVIQRQIENYKPFEIYVKSLCEFFRSHQTTAHEWERKGPENGGSCMFPVLDQYQKEGYHSAIEIARSHRGAFCCDGVGLGKTFIGLMLIERLVFFEKKNVVLIVPKSTRQDVWERSLHQFLPSVRGAFVNLQILNHTDIGRAGDYPEIIRSVTERAEAVIIDEAHNFRNPGSLGTGEKPRSRYWQLFDLIEEKECFFLTATPINNRLSDFRHMVELFSRKDEAYFAARLGIQSLRGHFIKLEKQLRAQESQEDELVETDIDEAREVLALDQLFSKLVVQRSRAYVKKSQEQEGGSLATFPVKEDPQIAVYSIKKSYGRLLDMIETAFNKENPLFVLGIYFPISYELNPTPKDSEDKLAAREAVFAEGRQRQVVGLIRTQFLKRFESSAHAFQRSSDRLLLKLLTWVTKHSLSEHQKQRLDRWRRQNEEAIGFVHDRQMELWSTPEEDEIEEDVVTPDMLEDVEDLEPSEYDVSRMLDDTYLDMNQIVKFMDELKKFKPANDDKLKALVKLLKTDKVMKKNKVLIFTEYAETATYLHKQLTETGIEGLECIHGGSQKNRSDVVERFSPHYNGLSSRQLEDEGRKEIRVLIATDVLSEGLNLQDATRIINYDIHWNPVRLMQRIGRVDRRMNPETEKAILLEHPDQKDIRGKVAFWNFLPPEELDDLIRLYEKVSRKTLRISRTLGIEGRKLLRPDDDFDALKDFNERYEGEITPVEEMSLELQRLLQDDPELEERIANLPGRVYSGKEHLTENAQGVFFCYRIPGPPPISEKDENQDWTEATGTTHWFLYDLASESIVEEPSEIINLIRSEPSTPRRCRIDKSTLRDARLKVEKHIKNAHLRSLQAPIGVKPALKAWMELN